ncbi:MAG: hypothetical protein LBV69_05750 [Bacteroidales bacterium]|nr:hypothetical protein [Bacteroidales bacterium]
MNKNVFRPRKSKLKNIKIRLLPEKLSIIFSCYFNACRDFFVSLIEKENNNKNYIVIQKIKYKFVGKYFNVIIKQPDVWQLCKTNLGSKCLCKFYIVCKG